MSREFPRLWSDWRPDGDPPNEFLRVMTLEEFNANGHGDHASSHHGPYIRGGDVIIRDIQAVNARDFPTTIAPRPCVVDMLVPERVVTSIYGSSGVVKSTLVLDLVLAAARGDEYWLGRKLGGQYPSVFIDFELDLEEQAKRSRQLCAGRGKALPETFDYIGGRGRNPVDVFRYAYKFCADNEVRLIAIDSAGLALPGDATKYRDVITFFQYILDTLTVDLECTIVLIDHQANPQQGESYQSKMQFGSSYKGNLSRSRIQIQLKEIGKGVRRITLRHNKANFTDYVEPFDVTVKFTGNAITLKAESMEGVDLAQEQQLPAWKRMLLLLDAEDDPMDRTQITTFMDISYGTAGNALTQLRKKEYIRDLDQRPDRTKPVEITQKGREFVEQYLSEYTRIITSPALYKDRDRDDTSPGGDDDPPEPDPESYTYVRTTGELADFDHWISERAGTTLGFDLETTGVDPYQAEISLMQISDGEQTYVLDAMVTDLAPIAELLRSSTLVAHNADFERAFIARHYGVELDVQDTIVMAKVLEQGCYPSAHTNSYGLEATAERYLGETVEKEQQTSDWAQRPLSCEQLSYAAKDARILVPLYDVLQQGIEAAGLEDVLEIERRAEPAFRWMEDAGVYVNKDLLKAYIDDLTHQADSLHAKLLEHAEINWASGPQIAEYFELKNKRKWPRTDKGKPSTKDADLQKLADSHPEIEPLLQWRRLQKRSSTYGEKWLQQIGDDGRIHARYDLMGTVTGRTSCRGPNLQNLPRDTPHKRAISAPEGRVLIKADYSQIELRIAAKLVPDRNLLDLYVRGDVDVHTRMASAITGKPESEITEDERTAAKAANFGPLYGMGAKRLRADAKAKYGVEWTLDEAKDVLRTFKTSYPGIADWHKDGYKPNETNRSELAPTRTLAGRRRTHFKSVMDWFNTPIQGTGADGAKLAMALLYERRATVPSMVPVLFVHDEIVVECDKAEEEQAKALLIACMEDGMNAVLNKEGPRIPLDVEAKTGVTWA